MSRSEPGWPLSSPSTKQLDGRELLPHPRGDAPAPRTGGFGVLKTILKYLGEDLGQCGCSGVGAAPLPNPQHGARRKTCFHPHHGENLWMSKALPGAEIYVEALATHGFSLSLSGSFLCNRFVEMSWLGLRIGKMK